MEKLFRFFKFLLIPIRVPLGTVSLLTVGPLAIGISTAAITVGTATVAKFGRSGQRFLDPDSEAISNLVLGTVRFLAAVANPFDELQNIKTGNFSSLNSRSDFSDTEKNNIKTFMSSHADEIGVDENISIEKAAKKLENLGYPRENIEDFVAKHNETTNHKETNPKEIIQNLQTSPESKNKTTNKETPSPLVRATSFDTPLVSKMKPSR